MVDLTGISEGAVGELITVLEGLADRTDGLNEVLTACRNAMAPAPQPPA